MFNRKNMGLAILLGGVAFGAQANFSTSEYGTGQFNTGAVNSFIHGIDAFTPIASADLSGTITDLESDCTSTSFPDEIDFMDADANGTLTCQEVNSALASTTGVTYSSSSKQQATFILTHLDACATVDAACLSGAASAANNFMTSSLSDAGASAISSLATAIGSGSSTSTSSVDDDLHIFDTNHDGSISGTEIINLLDADPNITSTINKPSSDTGLYARAYLDEISQLGANPTAADINSAITAGNSWAVYAPQITAPSTLALDGTASTVQTDAFTVYDGSCATTGGSGCTAAPGNVSYQVTTTMGSTSWTHSNSANPFTVNSSGRIVVNTTSSSISGIQDLDAGTYSVNVQATDTNTDTYGLTDTVSSLSITVSNENGCITNTQVTGSDFNANTDSITGAAVSITGSFDSSDLLFIQGDGVTTQTVGANSIKKYTTLGVSGITEARYDPSTGIMRFYGTTTEANWVSLFKRVGYIFNSSAAPGTSTRTLAFTLSNRVPYLHSDNTYHYYEYFANDDITFKNARVAAAADGNKLFGMRGYLATPTSQAEQDVLTEKVQGIGWLGACDNLDDTTPKDQCGVSTGDIGSKTVGEGYWYWVTGPEKMTQFGYDNGLSAWTVTNSEYENWNGTAGPDEPNNCCSTQEHYLHVWGSAMWNDFHYNNGSIQGYLVEWGGMSGDPSVDLDQTVSYSIPSGDANFCSYAE